MSLGEDQRSLVRPLGVTAVHGIDVVDQPCEFRGLSATRVVQRGPGMTLPEMIAVPVRFAVAREDQRRHEGEIIVAASANPRV